MMKLVLLPLLFLAIAVQVSSWQPPQPPPQRHASSSASRRQWLTSTVAKCITAATTLVVSSTPFSLPPPAAEAAPPIAIIAQELGYFPVTNSQGATVYVPKRVSRDSSEQAIALASHLRTIHATVYETYWCPHSARQREVFGRQAWDILTHVECSPKGYRGQPAVCISKQIDGYPTWIIRGKVVAGERSLSELAKASAFPGTFDEALEQNVPPSLGSASCR